VPGHPRHLPTGCGSGAKAVRRHGPRHAGINRLGLEKTGLAPHEVHPLLWTSASRPPARASWPGVPRGRRGDAPLLGALAHQDSAHAAAASGLSWPSSRGLPGAAAAHAVVHEGRLIVDAFLAMPDGTRVLRSHGEGDPSEAAHLGARPLATCLSQGGDKLLADARALV